MTRSRLIKYLSLSTPLLTALVLYGYSVGLPFFWDDGPQFRLLETSNGLDVWLGNADYLYYRPAVFTLWKISAVFAGFYDAVGLHWLNIIFFGMAGVILGKITYRFAPANLPITMSLIVGNGFVIFPFSYQAVTWIGSMFHTFLAMCLALCVLCALIWVQSGARWAWVVGTIAGFLGIFSHEIGVVIPVAVVMMWVIPLPYWTAYMPPLRRITVKRAIAYLIPLAMSAILFVVLYINVPRDTSPGQLQPMSEIVESSAILGQSVFYPFIALMRPFIDGTPPALPMVIGILAGLVALLGIIWLFLPTIVPKKFYIRLALLGMGWCGLMLAPSLLLLDQFYINGSPRLLLLPSMGISLLWGVVLIVMMYRRVGLILFAGMIALSVYVAIVFLENQRDYFSIQNEYAQRLFTMVKAQDPNADTVLVNAPNYITPLDDYRMFLRGAEGAAFLVHTVNYADYLWINTGVQLNNLQTVKYGILNQAVGYSMNAHGDEADEMTLVQTVRDADVVYVNQFYWDGIMPVAVKLSADGTNTPLYAFEDALTITELGAVFLPENNRLRVHIRWGVNNPQVLQAFVHVLCGGEMIGQVDAGAWGGAYPFHLWDVGEIQTDLREIPLIRPYTDDCEAVLGAYRPSDVTRLTITDTTTGDSLPNDQIIIPYMGESEEHTWILNP